MRKEEGRDALSELTLNIVIFYGIGETCRYELIALSIVVEA